MGLKSVAKKAKKVVKKVKKIKKKVGSGAATLTAIGNSPLVMAAGTAVVGPAFPATMQSASMAVQAFNNPSAMLGLSNDELGAMASEYVEEEFPTVANLTTSAQSFGNNMMRVVDRAQAGINQSVSMVTADGRALAGGVGATMRQSAPTSGFFDSIMRMFGF